MKLVEGLASLRQEGEYEVIKACLRAVKGRAGFRVVEFSVMSNHLHLVVEADGQECLARGMKSLCIRMAKGLNRL